MKSGNRKTYSFKSVGKTARDDIHEKTGPDSLSRPPIGIKTPLEFTSDVGGLFKMHTNLSNQINDNLRNLIMTNHGERLGHYDFGANLVELAFELGNEEVDSVAMRRIARATEKYMPFVSLDSFEPFVDRKDNEHVAKIGIRITYTVPRLAISPRSLEVVLFAAG